MSETGVTPDIEVSISDEDYAAVYYGTLEDADDAQLQAAIDAVRAKIS